MISIKRFPQNPILVPDPEKPWEALAVFNGCPIKKNKEDKKTYLVYRAISLTPTSSIGIAESKDGTNFTNRKQFIKPEKGWEKFGCEDPRITKFDNQYYIFYTALSHFPPVPEGIKIGLALSKDLKKIEAKHPVTPFNSKAMALFPEKIKGKMAAVLTVNTDKPPAEICLAFFDKKEQIWSQDFWQNWFKKHHQFTFPLQKNKHDQIEVGSPPIKTKKGWLLIYCCIKNYSSSPNRIFGVEAALLDLKNPLKIIGHTTSPLLTPKKGYEVEGQVANVIFPSGALIQNNTINLYYGAADTTCCLVQLNLEELLKEMQQPKNFSFIRKNIKPPKLERFKENPIIEPRQGIDWEAKGTFNPAAVYAEGKVHLIYRAFSNDHTSTLGYARLTDNLKVEVRPTEPIYIPREKFEKKATLRAWSGCEDPRITRIKDTFFMCYTAFDGKNSTRIALTSIKVKDFLAHRWNWKKPILISPPGIDDKNACILPEKINGKYVIFHRIHPCIWIDFVKNLNFGKNHWIKGSSWFRPRTDKWDSRKIGIASPPIKTKKGWLLLYHGSSEEDRKYRVGVMLLDLKNPTKVLSRPDCFILQPEKDYELKGHVPNVVFPCGAVVIKNKLFVYYGGADYSTSVAWTNLNKLLNSLF